MDPLIKNMMSKERPGIAIAGLGLKKTGEAKDVEDAKLAGDCRSPWQIHLRNVTKLSGKCSAGSRRRDSKMR